MSRSAFPVSRPELFMLEKKLYPLVREGLKIFLPAIMFSIFPQAVFSQDSGDDGFAPLSAGISDMELKTRNENGTFLKELNFDQDFKEDNTSVSSGTETGIAATDKEDTAKVKNKIPDTQASPFHFSQDEWNDVSEEVEEGKFSDNPVIMAVHEELQNMAEPERDRSQVFFKKSGTSLSVTGRKVISLNYSGKTYMKEQTTNNRDKSSGEFSINQEMQVKIHGKVGDKITVNVDYDDTKDDAKDISVVYQGNENELVQNVSFGDIELSLPSTEFVSYNQQLFGIKANLKSSHFNMTLLGSRTKGESKTKEFTGNTEFKKVNIYDTAYMRRKYYKLNFGLSSLIPIKPSSEKIYVDKQTSSAVDNVKIFEMTGHDYNVYGSSYTGHFQLMKRGVDYTIDYSNGIITFTSSLSSDYTVIVDYSLNSSGTKLSNLGSGTGYKILKTKNDIQIADSSEYGYQQELKTYYSIGQTNIVQDDSSGNFTLDVEDLSYNSVGSTLSPKQTYSGTITVDFENGTFHLTNPFGSTSDPNTPDPQVYSASPTSKRLFHIEYHYKFKTFTLDSDIVTNSETVRVDGKKYTRNKDYYIDYDSGYITFYRPDEISSTSKIVINYEVSEYGGNGTQSLVGGRAAFNWNKLELGSTVLYQTGSKSSTAPDISDIIGSMTVYEGDIKLNNLNLFGLRTSVGAEVAVSQSNPNLNDAAIIDNMEGIKQEDTASLDKNYWQIASNPTEDPADPTSITWDNESVNTKVINANATTDTTQDVLVINYDFTKSDEVSIVYPLSTAGLDFAEKSTFEFTVYSDNVLGPQVNIHYGQINEDADGEGGQNFTCSSGVSLLGYPKSEDTNCDEQLGPSEDVGWLYSPSGLTSQRYGAGNGRLDTEDLNGNGRMDSADETGGDFGYVNDGVTSSKGSYYFYYSGEKIEPVLNFTGWRTLTAPVEITDTYSYLWNNIKQVRISLKPNPLSINKSGTIKIALLGMSGNKWLVSDSTTTNTGSLKAEAVNNVDNTDYTPIYDVSGTPSDIYNSLYGSVSDQKSESNQSVISEQSLKITYSSITAANNAYIYKTYTEAIDMSQHDTMRFLLKNNSGSIDSNLYFYLLAGSDSNYFKVKVPMNFTGWQLIEVNQYDATGDSIPDYWTKKSPADIIVSSAGTPSLSSISQFMTGFEVTDDEEHSGSVYLDEIHVTGPISRSGIAKKLETSLELPGWFSLTGKYIYKDRGFETPTSDITNQDNETTTGNLNITRMQFFPITVTAEKQITVTPNASDTGDNNLVSSISEGRVKKFTGSASGTLNYKSLPKITLNYNKETEDYNTLSRNDDKDTYATTLNYNPQIKFFLIPTSISANYSFADSAINYKPENLADLTSVYNTDEKTDIYGGKMTFAPWSGSNVTLNYSMKDVKENRDYLYDDLHYSYQKSMNQTAGFSSNLRFFKWLNPTVNYSITTNETNNISTTTVTVGTSTKTYELGEIKTVTRSATGGVNVSVSAADLFPRTKLFHSFSVSGGYQLEDGDTWYYVEKDYDTRWSLWIRDRLNPKNSQASLNNMTLRDTYTSNIRWQPLERYALLGKLAPLKTITLTNSFTDTQQYSEVTETVTQTKNVTLPDLVLSMSQLETMLNIRKWVQSMSTSLKFSNNTATTEGVEEVKTLNYSGDLRFKLMDTVDTAATYSASASDTYDITDSVKAVTAQSRTDTASLQGSFDCRKIRLTPKIDYTKTLTKSTLGTVTGNTKTTTFNLQAKSDFSVPRGLKLPFTSKIITLTNKIVWTGVASYALTRSPVTESDNKNVLTLSCSADYEISKNLRLTINGSVERLWHKKLPEEEYISYDIGSTLTFQF